MTKLLDLEAIKQALPKMSDNDLKRLMADSQQFAQIITREARQRRGITGVGVLGVNGRIHRY